MPYNGRYLLTEYRPDPSVDLRRSSALRLLSRILVMDDLVPAHRKELLSIALWKWTEAVGIPPHPKYNLRFVSTGARTLDPPSSIQHEHVWTRKWIIGRLLGQGEWTDEELRDLLERYGVACVVTVEEHARLGNIRSQGWARYIAAGVEVWDRTTGQPLDLTASADVDQPEEPDPAAPEADAEVTAEADLARVISERAPARAELFRRLVRSMRFAGAVSVPGGTKSGEQVGDYFRIHDTVIEEPTPAAAYVHWNGRVSARLAVEDLPEPLRAEPSVSGQNDARYGVKVIVKDERSVEAAEEVVFLALEKLRAERSA